jgi:uncharacterized protein YdaU (DUF1376 family)
MDNQAKIGGVGADAADQAAFTPNQSPSVEDGMAKAHSKSPAFQFYPKDFLSSSRVQRMSYAEVGVYAILLSRCWLDNGLPGDVDVIAKLLKIPRRQFVKMWHGALGECFTLKAGRYRNDRLDAERFKQDAYRRRQSDRAEQRWKRKSGDAVALQETHPPALQGTHASGNALRSSSSSAFATTSKSERRAPIHTGHQAHAHCGRICVPAFLHTEFVGRWPSCPDPDMAVRDWYLAVEREWATKSDALPEPKVFWQSRFAEKWPVAAPAAPVRPSNEPAWVQRGREAAARLAAKAAQS